MENFKDLVKFNRYKSVESFNNATDVTSSTISIVKLDKNVMDIYLGRTQLTHSNFPEVSVELRNLIDSLGSKLNELKTDFNSKLTSADEKYNKKLSEYIAEFESGLIDLVNYTDELSKEIFDAKSDIQKKYDDTNKQIKNITDSITKINGLISNQNKITNELSNKVAEIKSKQISETNNIKKLNRDVDALKVEDAHIFDILNDIKKTLSKLIDENNDISISDLVERISKLDTTDVELNNNIINLKEKIAKLERYQISSTNKIKNIENDISALKIEDAHIFDILNNLKSINTTIVSDIKLLKEDDKKINNEILLLKEKIEYLSGVNVDNIETLEGVNRRLNKLESADKAFQKTIDKLNETIKDGVNAKLNWLIL